MPRYRVLEKSFINNHIRDAGDIVEYTGVAGKNLELLDANDKPVATKKVAPAPAAAKDTGEDLA